MSSSPPASVPGPAASACSCGSTHDHGPTGADIVTRLRSGFAILTLVIPAMALVLAGLSILAPVSTPLPLLAGIGLGIIHALVMIGFGSYFSATSHQNYYSPTLVVLRVVVEEALRLTFAMLAVRFFTGDTRAAMGLWMGIGVMIPWAVFCTVQMAWTRRLIGTPGEWASRIIHTLHDQQIAPSRALTMRTLDVLGLFFFQIGATILVVHSPIMLAATAVLSIATGFSTLVVARIEPRRRKGSPWTFAPFILGALTFALAFAFVIVPSL